MFERATESVDFPDEHSIDPALMGVCHKPGERRARFSQAGYPVIRVFTLRTGLPVNCEPD
jgi:hypothetical protein